jgi:hypothetical protein
MQLWMGGIAPLPNEGGPMTSIQAKFAVFYGKVDERPSGWYWAATSEPEKPFIWPIAGPFETKAQAVEDAHQRQPHNHEHRRRGD